MAESSFPSISIDKSMMKSTFESLGVVLENGKPRFRIGEPAFSIDHLSFGNNFTSKDEESFVVLGKSSMDFNAASLADYEQIQEKSMAVNCNSIISTLSHEEIEQKVTELLQENVKLKETILKNNDRMKQQFNTLATWQDELRKVHENHKQKFAETRDMITLLKKENLELKSKVAMEGSMLNFKCSGDMIDESIRERQHHAIDYPSLEEAKTSSLKIYNSITSPEMIQSQNNPLSELIKSKERQDRDMHYLQEIITSLKEQIRVLSENSFTPIQMEHELQSSRLLDKNCQGYLENIANYNEKLTALVKCYTAQTSRYVNIQNCLKRATDCLEQLVEKQEKNSKLEEKIHTARKVLDDCRNQLINEQLENIVERKSLIKVQDQFQKIFSDYSSVLHELEILEEEHSKPVEKRITLFDEQLDLEMEKMKIKEAKHQLEQEKKSFLSEKENFEMYKESLEEEKASLNSQSLLYEAEMKSMQDMAKSLEKRHIDTVADNTTKFKQEIEKKEAEIESQTEMIELLRAQVEIYKNDFEEESKSRQNLLREREALGEQLEKLNIYKQTLLQQLNGRNGHQVQTDTDGIPVDTFCESCGLYKMPGQWHGPGFCQPVD